MAKDYGKKRMVRPSSGVLRHLAWVLSSFLIGYLSASFVDIKTVNAFLNEKLFTKQGVPIAKNSAPEALPLPKPKFEFYTLLTNEHTAPVSVVAAVPNVLPGKSLESAMLKNEAPAVSTDAVIPIADASVATRVSVSHGLAKNGYLIQVASFRKRQDAARMKASLTLKGFDVIIASVTQQQTNWHRVMIGPFASRVQAEKAQGAIARSEHIIGMIRKMDA